VAAPQLLSPNAGQGLLVSDGEDGTLDGSAGYPVAALLAPAPIGAAPLGAPVPIGAALVVPPDGGALLIGAIVGVGEGAGAV